MGYYLVVRPLAPGTHTLRFGGTFPAAAPGGEPNVIDVTYTITVA